VCKVGVVLCWVKVDVGKGGFLGSVGGFVCGWLCVVGRVVGSEVGDFGWWRMGVWWLGLVCMLVRCALGDGCVGLCVWCCSVGRRANCEGEGRSERGCCWGVTKLERRQVCVLCCFESFMLALCGILWWGDRCVSLCVHLCVYPCVSLCVHLCVSVV
jgi:hypothetical protein